MGCLSSTQVAAIQAEIITLNTQITAVEAAYLASLGNAEIEEYRFNSGEGNQMARRRSPKQLREEIDALKAQRSRLQRKLNGTDNVNMNLRRRRHGHGHVRSR